MVADRGLLEAEQVLEVASTRIAGFAQDEHSAIRVGKEGLQGVSPEVGVDGYGVHSEVGRLRKVLVCAPGMAHERLTPTNSDDLLFDDVMWVEAAQRDFVHRCGLPPEELKKNLAAVLDRATGKDWKVVFAQSTRVSPTVISAEPSA